MTRWFMVAIALVCLHSGFSVSLSAQTPTAIVDSFYPARLANEKAAEQFAHNSTYVLAYLDGPASRPYIVAAYTNGLSAAVRVLRMHGANGELVAEPDLQLMAGISPKVELMDLDGDGRPEVIASFSSFSGHLAQWVFKWDGSKLVFLGPASDGSTLLTDASFVDLELDGRMEIVCASDSDDGTYRVFKLQHGLYVQWKTLVFFEFYIRGTRQRAAGVSKFSVPDPQAHYLLRITNGDKGGSRRVSRATVLLNQAPVVTQANFNEQVKSIQVPVTLQPNNEISVELGGGPKSQVAITIEKQ